MKKTIKTVALCLALAGMGAGYTSCDSETVMQVLSTVIQMMQGQTTTYKTNSFTATYYELQYNGESPTITSSSSHTVSNMTTTIRCNSYTQSATVSMTDAALDSNMKVTGLSVSGLSYQANASQTQIDFDLTDSSSILGTLTIGSNTYTASNMNLITAKATNGQFTFTADIYFGENEQYAVNYTFTASLVNNNQ